MKEVKDYWFKPTERINGLIYIKDGNNKFVMVKGKIKKFKTTTAAANFIAKIERVRDYNMVLQRKAEKGE